MKWIAFLDQFHTEFIKPDAVVDTVLKVKLNN